MNKKTNEEFINEIYNLVGDEYSILSEYVNAKTKVLIRHNDKCGYEYFIIPNSFTCGVRCPKCAKCIKKTTEQFKQEIYDLVGNSYTVLGEYIGAKNKIKIKHNDGCGHIYEVNPTNFIHSLNKCPRHKESKNENIISKYLNNLNINYKTQYKFENCKNKRCLLFDFALFDNEENLICLVEYDGEQHFDVMRFSKNINKQNSKFTQVKEHDKIKNDYCKANNITLIRIPYFQKSKIEEILNRRLNRLINN